MTQSIWYGIQALPQVHHPMQLPTFQSEVWHFELVCSVAQDEQPSKVLSTSVELEAPYDFFACGELELGAFMGIEMQRGLTAKGFRQAEVEY